MTVIQVSVGDWCGLVLLCYPAIYRMKSVHPQSSNQTPTSLSYQLPVTSALALQYLQLHKPANPGRFKILDITNYISNNATLGRARPPASGVVIKIRWPHLSYVETPSTRAAVLHSLEFVRRSH